MEDYSDKRNHERRDCKTPVHLYRYDTPDTYYDADMYNYSEGGGYLQTTEKINVGQQVYVKIKNYYRDVKGPGKYETYTGYVRWSNELGTSSPGGQYGYGIEYEIPVYY